MLKCDLVECMFLEICHTEFCDMLKFSIIDNMKFICIFSLNNYRITLCRLWEHLAKVVRALDLTPEILVIFELELNDTFHQC